MLLLQRAAETVSGDDECNDPAVLLACALGSTGCPAKCADEAQKAKEDGKNPYEGVQAGDLNVAVSTSSSVTSIPNSGVLKVAELSVKASENIQLQSLNVARLGLSQNKGLKVWIEKDGRRITSSSSFFGDSKANLTFNNGGYVVNGNETLDLVVSLSGDAGAELQFKVSDVVASSKNTTVSPDTTGVFRTTTYTVTTISTVPKTAWDERNYDVSKDSSYSFGEFQLINNSSASMEKDAMIKSITFKVDVDGWSIENLSNWKLLKDSKEVSSKYTVDGKSLTFAVNDKLESGKSATYKVTAEPKTIETKDGDEYQLRIAKAEDIIAEEIGNNNTAFRVSVKGSKSTENYKEIKLWKTIIKGWNITLTRDSNFASNVNANWWYSDVVIAKGTIKVNQAAKFEKGLTVNTKKTGGKDLEDIIRRASLKIGSKTYQAATIAWVDEKGKLVFDSEIYLEKGTQDFELLISLANTSDKDFIEAVESIEFANIDGDSFVDGKYLNGDETEIIDGQIAGSIRVAKVTIAEQKFSFKKTWPSEDVKLVEGNTDEKILLAWEITNSQDKAIDLDSFKVKLLATPTPTLSSAANFGKIYIAVIDGSTSSTETLTNTADKTFWIDAVSTSIEPGKTVKFELRYIPHAGLENGDKFKVSVEVSGKSDGNTVSTSPVNSATVTVTDKASWTVSKKTVKNRVLLPWKDEEIAAFDYKVKNDSMEVNTMQLKVAGNFTPDYVDDLSINFGGSVWSPTFMWNVHKDDDGNLVPGLIDIKFDNAVTIPASDKNYNVVIKANFAESAAQEDEIEVIAVAINPTEDFVFNNNAKNGVENNGYGSLGYSHYVAKAIPTISASKDGDILYITVSSSSQSKENMKVTGFDIKGKVVSVAFDKKPITDFENLEDLNEAIANQDVSLSAWDSVELKLQASRGSTVEVLWLNITVWEGDDAAEYEFDSNHEIGDWTKFIVTAGGDTEGAWTVLPGEAEEPEEPEEPWE